MLVRFYAFKTLCFYSLYVIPKTGLLPLQTAVSTASSKSVW